MKTLLLMRHAKSSWKDPLSDDHLRPLNRRGTRDAPRMGRLLKAEKLVPDVIVGSSARRARDTAEMVADKAGFKGKIDFTDRLYDSDVKDHCAVIAGFPSAAGIALLVGHNPCLEELLEYLTGSDAHLPTAAIARIEFSIKGWAELKRQTGGKLVHLWTPKELDD